MIRLIETLRRELDPRLSVRRRGGRKSTMNIGTIHGGHNTNAVPSECVIEIDRRTLADEKVDRGLRRDGSGARHLGRAGREL